MKKKVLVIRFSSIGDIVLTSPVLRCLYQQNFEVHFLVKERFFSVVKNYPYLHHIHAFHHLPTEQLSALKKENFDFVVDLQNNWKSKWLCMRLNKPFKGFPKLNLIKLLVVLTKQKWLLPKVHIVDRYFKAIQPLGVEKDNMGLDFFIDEKNVSQKIRGMVQTPYSILVPGGSYFTKQIPLVKIEEILKTHIHQKFIAIGDSQDYDKIKSIENRYTNLINMCGQTNLDESAFLIQHAEYVITSDTGMMHIAAALKKKIISVWGNTIPEFGMYPYMPAEGSKIIENNAIWCRPCSKLGYSKCPLGHFKCMRGLNLIYK
ncbi:MAG: glycosyltransferase family 9 protein [Bacteroidia bacterium]|nr:glycosyltransferase family 9 protein [Bacteroidia bacterium]